VVLARLLAVLVAVPALVIGWRVPSRAMQIIVGVLLLAIIIPGGVFSFQVALFVATMGISALALAFRTPRSVSPATRECL